jgi:hypothetical protein
MNAHTNKEFQSVSSGWNYSSVGLKLQFRQSCNFGSVGLKLKFYLFVTLVLTGRNRSPVRLQLVFCPSVGSVLSVQFPGYACPYPPPFPGVWSSSASCIFSFLRLFWGKKRVKSGGSSPFYHIKRCATTTHQDALSIVVSVGSVVAVAAVLQNFVVDGEWGSPEIFANIHARTWTIYRATEPKSQQLWMRLPCLYLPDRIKGTNLDLLRNG